jgi:hypothetical protein
MCHFSYKLTENTNKNCLEFLDLNFFRFVVIKSTEIDVEIAKKTDVIKLLYFLVFSISIKKIIN